MNAKNLFSMKDLEEQRKKKDKERAANALADLLLSDNKLDPEYASGITAIVHKQHCRCGASYEAFGGWMYSYLQPGRASRLHTGSLPLGRKPTDKKVIHLNLHQCHNCASYEED